MKPQSPNEPRSAYLARIFRGQRFTLDGEPIPSMPAFCEDNEVEAEEALDFARMAVGASFLLGGGAFATFTLTRES